MEFTSFKEISLISNCKLATFVEFEKPKSVQMPTGTREYKFSNNAVVASVVLINFNHGHYLEEALNSIINQTYPNIEIIVIDGGSGDNSKAILQKHNGIKWISEADNNGGHAFAKGVELATGSFVYFLTSSDGFFDTNWVKTSVELLSSNSGVALVSGDVIGVRKNSVLNGYKWPKGDPAEWGNKELFFNWLFNGVGFTPVSFVIRREVLGICAPSIDLILDYSNSNSVNYFWYLTGKFFNSGFIGIKLPVISTFVRFHGDRIEDAAYLPRQNNLLHSTIVSRRRELMISRKPAIFISPSGEVIKNENIPYLEVVRRFFLAKLYNIWSRAKSDSFDLE
jgi:glycosyltransferase involved in cell wall biosynthesis